MSGDQVAHVARPPRREGCRRGCLVSVLGLASIAIIVVMTGLLLLGKDVRSTFPSPTGPDVRPTGAPPPSNGSPELKAFQADCERGRSTWRPGQVDYPQNLTVRLDAGTTYEAAVDVRDTPLPADRVIRVPGGQATSEDVVVQCILAARLVAVDDAISVVPPAADGWVYREFTPTGVVEWAWSVEATTPVDHELRLDLRPVVKVDGAPGDAVTEVSSFTTEVHVDATTIERTSHWFATQWPLVVGIATVIGGAVLALKAFGGKLFTSRASGRHGSPAR